MQETSNKVLKDEEFISNLKGLLLGVKKHGYAAVMNAINFLDFKKEDRESDFNKIIEVVCIHVEKKTGRSKSLLKKEIAGSKRGEYTTARTLTVLFLVKYLDMTQVQIGWKFSRRRKDFVHKIKSSFKVITEQNNLPHIKLVGSVNRDEYLDLYNNINLELEQHFKKVI